jgi:MerR family transcriptional regulator, copper efflux regulator
LKGGPNPSAAPLESSYLQNGQPPPQALAAAEAPVANSAMIAAAKPRIVVFIFHLPLTMTAHPPPIPSVGAKVHWRVKGNRALDSTVDLKVSNTHMGALLIGDVAKRTGLTPATIRYYESIGLLSAPPRSGAGYRRYAETTVHELDFIRKAQGLGFSLAEVQEILRLSRHGQAPCSHVLELAKRHLAAVEERITQLSRFRSELVADIAHWEQQDQTYCGGVCQIIAGSAERTAPAALHTKLPQRRPRKRARTHA